MLVFLFSSDADAFFVLAVEEDDGRGMDGFIFLEALRNVLTSECGWLMPGTSVGICKAKSSTQVLETKVELDRMYNVCFERVTARSAQRIELGKNGACWRIDEVTSKARVVRSGRRKSLNTKCTILFSAPITC